MMEAAAAATSTSAATTTTRDWANMPPEIMDLIVKKIDRYGDFIVFGSACKSFLLATSYAEHPETPSNYPLLMLSDGTNHLKGGPTEGEKIIETRSFCSIYTSKLFDVNLPQAFGKRCLAVNFGWLLTVSVDQEIKLLHPFSKRQIDLPDCRTLMPHSFRPVPDKGFYKVHPFFIYKAVISSSPDDSNNNCIVFVVFAECRRPAFTRIGEDHWTVLENDHQRNFADIIYHKGLMYALSAMGIVFKCDIDAEHPKLVAITPALPRKYSFHGYYLVEVDGNLWVVSRTYGGSFYDDLADEDNDSDNEDETLRYYTSNFTIFKMESRYLDDDDAYPYFFVRVISLGCRVLFLGNNSSACVQSTKNNLLKGNCIYFTDNNHSRIFGTVGGGHDMGIFDYRDKTIQQHYSGPSRSHHSPPFWLI